MRRRETEDRNDIKNGVQLEKIVFLETTKVPLGGDETKETRRMHRKGEFEWKQ